MHCGTGTREVVKLWVFVMIDMHCGTGTREVVKLWVFVYN
jgi:hypothetical protein